MFNLNQETLEYFFDAIAWKCVWKMLMGSSILSGFLREICLPATQFRFPYNQVSSLQLCSLGTLYEMLSSYYA